MATNFQSLRLLADAIGTARRGSEAPAPADFIELPGPISLELREGELMAVSGRSSDAVALAPVQRQGQPLLVMTAPEGAGVRVNGCLAGPVEVLGVRDLLDVALSSRLWHVTLYRRPYAGPAAAEHAGRECPICLAQIELEAAVLVCASCGAVMHDEAGEARPSRGDDLQCARTVSTCPSCEQPLVREEGYAYIPE